LAVHQLDQVTHDDQTEAGAGVALGLGSLELRELAEQFG